MEFNDDKMGVKTLSSLYLYCRTFWIVWLWPHSEVNTNNVLYAFLNNFVHTGLPEPPFWLKPEPFIWSGSGSYSYSTVNILFLRNPKCDYKFDSKYDYVYDYDDCDDYDDYED